MALSDEIREQIFSILKKNLLALVPPMVEVPAGKQHHLELTGNKPVPYGYDKKIIPGMYFASVVQRKDSVAFYYFPVYSSPELMQSAPGLKKCLKGKSCFHFKKPEQIDEKELQFLLKKGMEFWKKSGYMQETSS